MSTGADRKANALGGGLPQFGDLRLLEDGGERGDALVPDIVSEPARNGWRHSVRGGLLT